MNVLLNLCFYCTEECCSNKRTYVKKKRRIKVFLSCVNVVIEYSASVRYDLSASYPANTGGCPLQSDISFFGVLVFAIALLFLWTVKKKKNLSFKTSSACQPRRLGGASELKMMKQFTELSVPFESAPSSRLSSRSVSKEIPIFISLFIL